MTDNRDITIRDPETGQFKTAEESVVLEMLLIRRTGLTLYELDEAIMEYQQNRQTVWQRIRGMFQ